MGFLVSGPSVVCATILAGCGYATTLLRVLLRSELDNVVREHRLCRFFNVVGDIATQVIATAKLVRESAVKATRELCDSLEARQLIISRSKGKVVASTAELSAGICAGLKQWGFKSEPSVWNLGCDYSIRGRAARVQKNRTCRI
eukprot:5185192-Pyramimonas_sp.AAC.1